MLYVLTGRRNLQEFVGLHESVRRPEITVSFDSRFKVTGCGVWRSMCRLTYISFNFLVGFDILCTVHVNSM